MADPTYIPAPNYTQIPNAIFDLMADKDAHLTEAELRVILAIARKTFGWHKKRDKISLSQLVKATAMTRTSVQSGLDAAMARGIVRRTPDMNDKRGGFYYELIVDEPTDATSTKNGLVQNLDQSNEYTRTSPKFRPELVQNLDPQKKEKEKKETSSTDDGDGRKKKRRTSLSDWLIEQGMGAAEEFADLDEDAAKADFTRRRRAGDSCAQIVRAWRVKPPVRKAPEQNEVAPLTGNSPEETARKLRELTRT